MVLLVILAAVFITLFTAVFFFVQQPKFGRISSGDRLEKVTQSPHFKNGKFRNLSFTPDLTEGVSYYAVLKEFLLGKSKRSKPAGVLPSVKTDLLNLDIGKNVLVWFGHSSYFIQVDGKKILVDPVLSGAASPLAFTTRSYPGTDIYTAADFPEIDYLFISHDHWDHLDYETISKLRPKIKRIFTGLGTGAHLEAWGYVKSRIKEMDWDETETPDIGFAVTALSARHFSGRGFTRNRSLWVSFVLQTPTAKIYLGGDSGYDTHFAGIGKTYGPFDLAILECGQYDKSWKYIHMMPEEVVDAANDLYSKKLMPVHWGKFSLGNHAWDDPILRVAKAAELKKMPLLTPMIGEPVNWGEERTRRWWEEVKS